MIYARVDQSDYSSYEPCNIFGIGLLEDFVKVTFDGNPVPEEIHVSRLRADHGDSEIYAKIKSLYCGRL